MNEELQTRITQYLDAIESSAETAGDFVVEQTPLLAQEYLAWMFWSNVFIAALTLLVAAVCGLICYLLIRASKKHPGVLAEAVFLSGFFGLVCVAIACTAAYDAIKVTVAPRVVLLEAVKDLL